MRRIWFAVAIMCAAITAIPDAAIADTDLAEKCSLGLNGRFDKTSRLCDVDSLDKAACAGLGGTYSEPGGKRNCRLDTDQALKTLGGDAGGQKDKDGTAGKDTTVPGTPKTASEKQRIEVEGKGKCSPPESAAQDCTWNGRNCHRWDSEKNLGWKQLGSDACLGQAMKDFARRCMHVRDKDMIAANCPPNEAFARPPYTTEPAHAAQPPETRPRTARESADPYCKFLLEGLMQLVFYDSPPSGSFTEAYNKLFNNCRPLFEAIVKETGASPPEHADLIEGFATHLAKSLQPSLWAAWESAQNEKCGRMIADLKRLEDQFVFWNENRGASGATEFFKELESIRRLLPSSPWCRRMCFADIDCRNRFIDPEQLVFELLGDGTCRSVSGRQAREAPAGTVFLFTIGEFHRHCKHQIVAGPADKARVDFGARQCTDWHPAARVDEIANYDQRQNRGTCSVRNLTRAQCTAIGGKHFKEDHGSGFTECFSAARTDEPAPPPPPGWRHGDTASPPNVRTPTPPTVATPQVRTPAPHSATPPTAATAPGGPKSCADWHPAAKVDEIANYDQRRNRDTCSVRNLTEAQCAAIGGAHFKPDSGSGFTECFSVARSNDPAPPPPPGWRNTASTNPPNVRTPTPPAVTPPTVSITVPGSPKTCADWQAGARVDEIANTDMRQTRGTCSIRNVTEQACKDIGGTRFKPDSGSGFTECFRNLAANPLVSAPTRPKVTPPRTPAPNVNATAPKTAQPTVNAPPALSPQCQKLVGDYVAAAQAKDGPRALAGYNALKRAGGCGVLAKVDRPAPRTAPPPANDPRFVARGATPLTDGVVGACDASPAECAARARQLEAGASPAAAAALYMHAINVGLSLGAQAGSIMMAVPQVRTTAPNMNSIGPGPVRNTVGQGSPLRPAPRTRQSDITGTK